MKYLYGKCIKFVIEVDVHHIFLIYGTACVALKDDKALLSS